jgi:hypothetical protein
MRTQAIEDRLTELFRTELQQTTVSVDRGTWSQMPLAPRFRYGYMPPVPITADGEQFVVTFCPELIDLVTAWLNEVMRRVEDELLDKAPNALAFMTEVEVQAIDDGVVPKL